MPAPKRTVFPYILALATLPLLACNGNTNDFAATALSSTSTPNPGAQEASQQGSASTSAGNANSVVSSTGTTSTSGGSTGSTTTSVPSTSGSLVAIPLRGCFASDYTVAVRLGDGSQYQLIVDTGSTTLAVAASACTNCTGISPKYGPTTTAVDDRFTASGLYGDGSSWTGEVFTDTVSMGSANDVPMAFATIDRQSMSVSSGRNFFNASYCSGQAVSNQTQGIIGFGVKKLALAHTDAYLDQVLTTNPNQADIVAAQFCDLGGNLWLGGYDPNYTAAAPTYTAMNTTNGYYEVTMQDLMLGGMPVGTSASYGAAIVDTGTSIMLVTSSLFDALGSALDNDAQFVSYFGPGFLANGSCSVPAVNVTRAILDAALPKMTLQFPGDNGTTVSLQMNATDSYLMAMKQPDGTVGYCAAVSSGAGTSGLPNVLLGNNVMHSQITIFDRVNNRLGLAPQVGCSRL